MTEYTMLAEVFHTVALEDFLVKSSLQAPTQLQPPQIPEIELPEPASRHYHTKAQEHKREYQPFHPKSLSELYEEKQWARDKLAKEKMAYGRER